MVHDQIDSFDIGYEGLYLADSFGGRHLFGEPFQGYKEIGFEYTPFLVALDHDGDHSTSIHLFIETPGIGNQVCRRAEEIDHVGTGLNIGKQCHGGDGQGDGEYRQGYATLGGDFFEQCEDRMTLVLPCLIPLHVDSQRIDPLPVGDAQHRRQEIECGELGKDHTNRAEESERPEWTQWTGELGYEACRGEGTSHDDWHSVPM